MTEKDWYKKWFGNEYLTVYSHRDEKEAEQLFQLILSNVSLNPQSKILDVCCGQGRHVSIFAQNRFTIFGIDLSKTLLEIAKNKTKELNSAHLIQADMRHLPTTAIFDLVLNLFTSFGYFDTDEENRQVLIQINNVLKKKGSFVLDYFNSKFVKDNLIPRHENKIGDFLVEQERYIENSRIKKKISIMNNGKRSTYFESVKMYQAKEVFEMLNSVGLKINKIYGDYCGSSFTDTSPRLLIFGAKND